ncbi:MAG: cation transporter [candidate division Zixibacteria bacterium SM23_81]|nr:MAG: cation transporter [candidate division Zixibacteria bacterium SM23_81]
MINRIIEFCLNNRLLVIFFTLLLLLAGGWALKHASIDAIPDIGENQTIVYVEWPGRSPQDVEDQVTYPLTVNLTGIPKVKVIRSNSMFGLSMVNIIFEEGVDFYWARTRILERLDWAKKDLPQDVTPILGPDATALGQIFWYTIEGEGYDLEELRSMQDWYVKYQLNSVPGVSEVASVGGFVKQYQIEVDPNKLLAYNVPLSKVIMAVRNSNIDVGAKVFEEGGMEFIIRGLGFIKSVDDIENIVVDTHDGVPILAKNVANVVIGPDFRRGALDKEGAEVVGAVVLMRYGENPREIIRRIKEKIEEIEPGLPPGVKIVPFYDRTELIGRTTATLRLNVILQVIVTVLVVFVMLRHLSASLVISIILPFGILITFLLMYLLKMPSNLMSISGIALSIGVMVDCAIIMTENIHKHLAELGPARDPKTRLEVVGFAAKQVGKPIFFSAIIIIIAFANIYFLRGQSGKLFRPLAFTENFVMAVAALLAIALLPVIISIAIRGKLRSLEQGKLVQTLIRWYDPIIRWSVGHKKIIIGISLIFLIACLSILPFIQSEFMPPLNEGDLLFMPVLLPGASLTQVMEVMRKQDIILKDLPEVDMVVGKLGRAETATDPAPVAMIETVVKLKPKKYWRSGMTREKLIREMDEQLRIPGVSNIWTQPIRNRIDMLATGIQTPVGVKVFGPDLKKAEEIAVRIEETIRNIKGVANPYAERVGNKPYLEITIDRHQAARYGISVADVNSIIMTAIGGMNLTTTIEGRERYPISVRYARELRDNVEALKRVLVPARTGAQIPLSQIADIRKVPGPAKISTENGVPYVRVFVGVDEEEKGVVDVVKEAQRVVKERIEFPPGYFISWSGQYLYELEARRRFMIVLPLCLFLIFVLLYMEFRTISLALLVFSALPFAFTGGILLQFILGYKFSTAVWVGYIALFGVAVEDGLVLIEHLKERHEKSIDQAVSDSVIAGAKWKLRPILMTTVTTILALFPIMFSRGVGSEIMKPIAAPIVGGMITATALNLILIPVLFAALMGWEIKREKKEQGDEVN